MPETRSGSAEEIKARPAADDGRGRLADAETARWQEMAVDVEATIRQVLLLPWVRRRLERGQPVTRIQVRLVFTSPEDAVEADLSLERG